MQEVSQIQNGGDSISHEVGRWFQGNRESYEWPRDAGRASSEKKIDCMTAHAKKAIHEQDVDSVQTLLVEIHRWKTRNRQGQTMNYGRTLSHLGPVYLAELLKLGTFSKTEELRKIIKHLKVEYCNLPVCTAIASFLYGRQEVPIIDKFLSQFFARRFEVQGVDDQTREVLDSIGTINFKLQDGGNGRLRLAVYSAHGFDSNLELYLQEFVPECDRIAAGLRQGRFFYRTVEGDKEEFDPIDVEMSVFSWASKHAYLF